MRPSAAQLIDMLDLKWLPIEGGLFVQTWRSRHDARTPEGELRPAGTCIYAMLTRDRETYSAMHRLKADEIWHFYLGDPIAMLLLHANGSIERTVLGQDVLGGQKLQVIVPA